MNKEDFMNLPDSFTDEDMQSVNQEQNQGQSKKAVITPIGGRPATFEERLAAFLARGPFDDLDPDITAPNFRLNIMGVDCCTSGELTAISGQPGAGKSTTLAILVGVLLGRTEFAGIRGLRPCGKVLWIDTEKGAFSCAQKMKYLRRIAKIEPPTKLVDAGVHLYFMRQECKADRLAILDAVFRAGDYDVVVIDGIFDLLEDPQDTNSPVWEVLQGFAGAGATVFAMLHTNKNDDNMRYATGTELQRLVTTRFDVEYDKRTGRHIIKHQKSNDTALAPEVAFIIEKDGNIRAADDAQEKQENSDALFHKVFGKDKQLNYTELWKRIKDAEKCSERTAKGRITEALDFGAKSVLARKENYYVLRGISNK